MEKKEKRMKQKMFFLKTLTYIKIITYSSHKEKKNNKRKNINK
jgi:hypothetical protein